MVCYVLPTAAALITWFVRKRGGSRENSRLNSLNLLFFGAAIFGVVDHLWNGELLLVGPNIFADIALGFAITLAVFAVWLAIIATDSVAKNPARN